MHKNTFFTGQPIFSQLLSLIPRSIVSRLAREYSADHYCKKFKSFDHLVTMLFSAFHHCTSLRELITGLQANVHRLQHLGLKYTPRRSTLADANSRRSSSFFEAVFHQLYRHYYGCLPDSLRNKSMRERLFIIDSTTITLFSTVLKGAGCYGSDGKKKGGVKAHLLVRAKDNLPCFVHLSAAAQQDKTFLPMLLLPKGSIVVMDRGYNSYKQMIQWTRNTITWVTRLHEWSVWEVLRELPVSEGQYIKGVRRDCIINLGNPKTTNRNPLQKVRLVTFYDKAQNREFQFICNDLKMSPLTIAHLYEKRWQIEVLFKRVKQNFPLTDFLGDNENAIKIQLWCTLIADLLLKIVKDKVEKTRKKKWSFSNLAGLVRQHLTTYIDLFAFLINPDKALIKYITPLKDYQMRLFKT